MTNGGDNKNTEEWNKTQDKYTIIKVSKTNNSVVEMPRSYNRAYIWREEAFITFVKLGNKIKTKRFFYQT